VHEIDAASLEAVAGTVQAQGILALVAQKTFSVSDILTPEVMLVVAVDAVGDPGNLGTLLRTCDWFGVDGVLLGKGSVELHNEKVVRSTAGSVLHLRVAEEVELVAALAEARRQGFTVVTASGDGAVDYLAPVYGFKNVFVFGSEAHGVSADVRGVSNAVVRIPRFGRVESLNVGVACGILLAHLRGRPS
jgi:TrmH family RNA methyltransferase